MSVLETMTLPKPRGEGEAKGVPVIGESRSVRIRFMPCAGKGVASILVEGPIDQATQAAQAVFDCLAKSGDYLMIDERPS